MVFWAALIPTIITTFCLYYLIFGMLAMQFGFPEVIAYHIIPAAKKVTFILLTSAPIAILLILLIAYKITHTIIGPFDRIIRELGEYVEGRRKGILTVRKDDKFEPLVNRINKLLTKLNK